MAQLKTGTTIGGYITWHAGNMGPSSGLDADLLDGQHGSYYAVASDLTSHTGNTSNPHGVTAVQAGAEPAFTKNTAFNKNFGTAAGTVCQGNDSRLSDARTPTAHTHTRSEITDFSHTHSAADITSGTLAVARGGTGIASYTVGNFIYASGATTLAQRTPAQVLSDIGAAASSHNHSGVYEPVFSKNTAFNKNFGTIAGTVCQGNDSRLSDARTPVAHTHTKSEITDFAHTHDYLPLTGGSLSGNLTLTAGNEDRYLTYLYTGGTYSWRLGYTGSGSGDANYFVIESSGADTVFDRALEIGATTLKTDFKTTPSVNGTLVSLTTHNHSGVYEPVFSKNTAFNKNFGTAAGTVCQGNDSRLSDARTPVAHTHAATDINSGILATARGGTGLASFTSGSYFYASSTSAIAQKTPAQVLSDIGAEAAFSKNTAFNKNFGTTAGTVCEGDDSRLSDARTPTLHTHTRSEITDFSHTHSATDITSGTLAVARGGTGIASYTAGNYIYASASTTLAQRTPAQVLSDIGAAASSHNHSGVYEPVFTKNTAFNKNFGTAAGTVCQGNDSRLSDARTPTTHDNTYHSATYVTQTEINSSITTHAGDADAHHTNANDPTADQKAALAGTSGIPSSTNKYVTNDDPRMTDARTPTSHNHAATEITSGTLAVARGGTGIASYTTGNYIYASGATTLAQRTPAQVLSDISAMPLAGGTFSGTVNFADNIAQRPEIKDYAETVYAHGTTGGAKTIDLTNGNIQTITLNAATTFTFSNPPATGKAGSLTLIINQGTTAYAVTWPSSVDWSGGSAPDLSTVSTDYVLTFLTLDGGTKWRGWLSGGAFA